MMETDAESLTSSSEQLPVARVYRTKEQNAAVSLPIAEATLYGE